MVWTEVQVEKARNDTVAARLLLPLTPRAMGAMLREGFRLPFDPLALLESPLQWRVLNAAARDGVDEVLARLEARRAFACREAALMAEPALDAWLAYSWFREFLHLRNLLSGLHETGLGLEATTSGHDAADLARQDWLVECALADLGYSDRRTRLAVHLRSFGMLPSMGAGLLGHKGEAVVVSAFGQPDIGHLLTEIRRSKPGRLIIVGEPEFAHTAYLREMAAGASQRLDPAEFLLPVERPNSATDPAKVPEPEAPFSFAAAVATALAECYWPVRLATGAAIRQVFAERRIVKAIVADHISDSGFAILAEARERGVPLRVIAHSGLPMDPLFRLPISRGDRGSYVVSTPARARKLASALSRVGSGIVVQVRKPQAFRRRSLETVARHMKSVRGAKHCRIGLLLTTGQHIFALDRPLAPVMDSLRAFLAECAGKPVSLIFRLREQEDDPVMLAHLLKAPEGLEISFQRVGQVPLGKFFGQVDVVIEVGAPTSASLATVARGVPVFRLARFETDERIGEAPGFPVLPENAAVSRLREITGSLVRRIQALRRQRKLFE